MGGYVRRVSAVPGGGEDLKVQDPASFGWLLASWREDLIANGGQLFRPGFQVLAVYRFGVWSRRQSGFLGWLVNKVYTAAYLMVRAMFGADLPRYAVIGRRLWLPHPVGVVISAQARIGDDCMIRQNVTIGGIKHQRERRNSSAPTLGSDVRLGAGAVVVGGVKVGDGARIGPNAVIMTDIPAGASAFARSAEILTMPDLQGSVPNAMGPISPNGAEDDIGRGYEATEKTSKHSEALSDFIRFISEAVEPDEEIDAQTPLISTGIVDSFDVAALLAAIETRYAVVINPEEVDVTLFDTPAQMLSRIEAARS